MFDMLFSVVLYLRYLLFALFGLRCPATLFIFTVNGACYDTGSFSKLQGVRVNNLGCETVTAPLIKVV